MPIGNNRVLGDPRKSEASRPHRVALGDWPTNMPGGDPRTATLEALCGHAASAGYEGFEFSAHSFARFFPGQSIAAVARLARKTVEAHGLKVFGATNHFADSDMRGIKWPAAALEGQKLIQDMGGEFASYQLFIAPEYMNTGGDYREDEKYLQFCADRVTELRDAAWENGLNFYLEVHVDRITEDPAACCRILELATCELNGDLSHMLCRGHLKGKHVDKVLDHVGHTHCRMARLYGDLSALVENPRQDWENKGSTWQLFQLQIRGMKRGLSSRTITGETGPAFLVKDSLSHDAALVPLWRAMARFGDAAAQGIVMKVEEPGDLRPWG